MSGPKRFFKKLGHDATARALSDLIGEAVKEKLSAHELLHRVLETEVMAKEEKRAATHLKFSGLPVGKTLEGFDFSFQPSINKGQIDTLSTCEFVTRKENVLIFGPPGVGKTHLAAGLGIKAIECGFTVCFVTLDRLISRLKKEAGETKPSAKRHRRSHLLIVDEIGYRRLNADEANLFFGLISKRYEHLSTMITSNKSVREWPEFLASDEVLTSAILDRLLHHAYAINITGRSWRLKGKEAMFNGD